MTQQAWEENTYGHFTRRVRSLIGIDLEQYKAGQVQRRLKGLLQRKGIEDLTAYGRLLDRDPAAREEFRNFLTINVSEFFRNPDRFTFLEDKVLPVLWQHRTPLKLWSAGCSHGAEPYSLAILLDRLTPGQRHRLLATDVDAEILAAARRGLYRDGELRQLDPVSRRRYLKSVTEGEWQLSAAIRGRVEFRQHDLLRDPFPADQDLIVCRNVVIYFTDEAKERLYQRLVGALRPGGVLFVGGTETIFQTQRLGLRVIGPSFYRRVGE